MTRRRWMLVGLTVGVAGLVGLSLAGRPATGAEAQARSSIGPGAVKVGIVDLSRAFKKSKSVQEARTALIQKRNDKLQSLKVRREEINRLDQELRNQGALLSDVVRRQKEKELRRKLRRLKWLRNDSEQELNHRYLSINRLFIADARKEIDAMGQDAGYTFIINVNNDLVLYGAESVDVTDRLIQRLND